VLFNNDGLNLNIADLLGDDAFGDFLQNDELLLDELDVDRLALLRNFGNDRLRVAAAVEVVRAVKVIEVRELTNIVPVVERVAVASRQSLLNLAAERQRRGRSQRQKGEDKKSCGCGEHGWNCWKISGDIEVKPAGADERRE